MAGRSEPCRALLPTCGLGHATSCEIENLAHLALLQLRWGRWPKAGWGVAGESVISWVFARCEASPQTVVHCPTPHPGFAHLPHQVGQGQLLQTSADRIESHFKLVVRAVVDCDAWCHDCELHSSFGNFRMLDSPCYESEKLAPIDVDCGVACLGDSAGRVLLVRSGGTTADRSNLSIHMCIHDSYVGNC